MPSLLLAARGGEARGASEGSSASPGDNASTNGDDASDKGGDRSNAESGGEARTDNGGKGVSLPAPSNPFGKSRADRASDAEESSTEEDEAPGAPLRALSCLEGEGGEEGDGARRGVQKRDFQKRHRFELGLLGGYVAMDALSSTYITGGTLAFYPSEDFGLEVLVSRTPVRFRLEEPFTSFDLQHRFTDGVAWQGLVSGLFSPFHAKFRFSEKSIGHADLFLLAGAGRTWHASVQGITGELGAGVKFYPWRYLSIRLDLRDFVYAQEVLGRGSTTHNIAVMAGLSLWGPG